MKRSAGAVSHYFGRFPVKRVTIEVRGGRGRVGNGRTWGGRLIHISVGWAAKQADLDDDWVMTHEMFHLAFPGVDERYHWMEEGLSTYLEPIARARVGDLTPERVWGDMVEGMPKGLPEEGDRGLDNTPTWGRTYWGGCLYWLLADVEIRRRTGNRKSLDDAIRAILDAGGDGSADWPVEKVIETGDRATGTTVLKDLHDRLGPKPEKTDLPALWKQLGVSRQGKHVTFDDKAPLGEIRRSMTSPVKD